MQKKLIALAVAGLVAAPAFAQSNVTVYGVVDMGFVNESSNVDGDVGSRNAVDSGIQSGSRLGFRGTEDLGNGLKASFVLEMGLNVDTGTEGQGRAFGRQAFAALSGGFGTVAIGRQYTPQFNLLAAADPFGQALIGGASNIYGWRGLTAAGRVNNLLAYVSPSFGGMTVTAGYTFNALADENKANEGDARVWAVSPVYSNGPLMVGMNYHQVKVKGASQKNNVWDLAATYDLGVAKLAAVYGQDKVTDGGEKTTHALLGATVPVGPAGKVLASYQYGKKDLSDAKAHQFNIGYTHDLSKRTNLYAAWGKVNNKDDGTAFAFGNGYTSNLAVGLRHRF
jgi:predicted porin